MRRRDRRWPIGSVRARARTASRLAGPGTTQNSRSAAQQPRNGQRDGARRHGVERRESSRRPPAAAGRSASSSTIFTSSGIVEIGDRRVVEGDVAVHADAEADDVDRRLGEQRRIVARRAPPGRRRARCGALRRTAGGRKTCAVEPAARSAAARPARQADILVHVEGGRRGVQSMPARPTSASSMSAWLGAAAKIIRARAWPASRAPQLRRRWPARPRGPMRAAVGEAFDPQPIDTALGRSGLPPWNSLITPRPGIASVGPGLSDATGCMSSSDRQSGGSRQDPSSGSGSGRRHVSSGPRSTPTIRPGGGAGRRQPLHRVAGFYPPDMLEPRNGGARDGGGAQHGLRPEPHGARAEHRPPRQYRADRARRRQPVLPAADPRRPEGAGPARLLPVPRQFGRGLRGRRTGSSGGWPARSKAWSWRLAAFTEERIRAHAAARPLVLVNRDIAGIPRVLIDSGSGVGEAMDASGRPRPRDGRLCQRAGHARGPTGSGAAPSAGRRTGWDSRSCIVVHARDAELRRRRRRGGRRCCAAAPPRRSPSTT